MKRISVLSHRQGKLPRNKRIQRQVQPARQAPPARSFDWGRMRLWCVAVFFCLLWVGLWGRAFYLQVIEGPRFAAMAKRQHTATVMVEGVRGSLLDRNGNILARSVECPSVWADPSRIADKQKTARELGRLLGLSPAKITPLLRENKRFVWIKRKVDLEAAERVKTAALPGIGLRSEYERVYPYKHLAGQLLGFVNIDDKGLEGLEKAFNPRLSGERVRQRVNRDAAGRRLVSMGSEATRDLRGENVRLTIDTQVQFFAEEALAESVDKFEAKWGGCIVVDVPSGEVLAWAQYPFFDPNNAGTQPQHVRGNRLITDALEQGSTIKSFLIAAALEEKVITPDTPINCEKGSWKLRSATIHDTHSYATLPASKILHVSSNIGAAKVGLKLGQDKYRDYLSRLGFGAKTGLPVSGETKGILRAAKQWTDLDLATASFGQSFSATLAQVAQAYLCLASNGIKRPLKLEMDEEGGNANQACSMEPGTEFRQEVIFSGQTMRDVRAMLREVVEEEGGTGAQARIPGLVVGGKTGTAQKADRTGRYGKGRVGSFVGMVPAENPRYLVCVILDEPTRNQYGGVVAAPVFRDVALRTMAYHGLLPDSDDPLVKSIAEKEAARKNRGKASGVAAVAKPAAPGPGAGRNNDRSALISPAVERELDALAGLLTQNAQGPEQMGDQVPSVVGMGVRSAVAALAAHGVMPNIKGKGGFVVRQEPASGSSWTQDKRECTIWLEERRL